MTTSKATTSTEGRDLILTRMIDAPAEKVFKAWTEPELLAGANRPHNVSATDRAGSTQLPTRSVPKI